MRKELSLKKTDKIITFIGLVGTRKGIDLLLDVAKQFSLDPKTAQVRFLVVGSSPSLERWKKKATANVLFLGRRNDIWNIFSITDVFFLPSRGEGLPGVVMEAMMAKVPVVSSNIPCVDTLISSESEGSLCKKEDTKAYAYALRRLLDSPALARKIAQKAHQKIITEFSWSTIAPRYMRLYGGS